MLNDTNKNIINLLAFTPIAVEMTSKLYNSFGTFECTPEEYRSYTSAIVDVYKAIVTTGDVEMFREFIEGNAEEVLPKRSSGSLFTAILNTAVDAIEGQAGEVDLFLEDQAANQYYVLVERY
jgi:uncharacterized protein (DUF697 family)